MPDSLYRSFQVREHLIPGVFTFAPLPDEIDIIRPNGSLEPEKAKLADGNTYLFHLFDDDLIDQLENKKREAQLVWSETEPFTLKGIYFPET